MAAHALNKMWEAVGEKQSADEFEHVEIQRLFWPPSDKRLRALTNRTIRAVFEPRHFIDPEMSEYNRRRTVVLPRRFHAAAAPTSPPGRAPMSVLGPGQS